MRRCFTLRSFHCSLSLSFTVRPMPVATERIAQCACQKLDFNYTTNINQLRAPANRSEDRVENERFPSLVLNRNRFAWKLQFPSVSDGSANSSAIKCWKLGETKNAYDPIKNNPMITHRNSKFEIVERQKWISEISEIGRQARSIKSLRTAIGQLTQSPKISLY